jgi:hypothetical protein
MNELNLSISTGKDDQNRVVLTAVFASHDEAVAFHSQVASLCNTAKSAKAKAAMMTMTANSKLLGWAR